jgi:hypothetical protein
MWHSVSACIDLTKLDSNVNLVLFEINELYWRHSRGHNYKM